MAQNISPETVAKYWRRLRARAPLVHCMTNEVVTNWTANVLLAAGASPAMVIEDSEAVVFAPLASALLINVGTLHAAQARAMQKAVSAACAAATPWVLDPVAVGVLPYRTGFCKQLLKERPVAVRGNPSEILALAGESAQEGMQGRGVDSTQGSEAALTAAQRLAQATGAVVAVTGATDYITDGRTTLAVGNGHSLLQRVTGTGCALSALVAAALGTTDIADQRLEAVGAACAAFAVAGEIAAEKTLERGEGPGSFAVYLLNALAALDDATLQTRIRTSARP